MPEKYKPQEEEIQKAEKIMTKEQKSGSKIREVIHGMINDYEESLYRGDLDVMDEMAENFDLKSGVVKEAAKKAIEKDIIEGTILQDIGSDKTKVKETIEQFKEEGAIPLAQILKSSSFYNQVIERHGITGKELNEIFERHKDKLKELLNLDQEEK